MTKLEYLLVCLMEESAELSQRASKALRFGLDEQQTGMMPPMTNQERLCAEFTDLIAIVEMLEEYGIELGRLTGSAIERKKKKVKDCMTYSEQCGTLEKSEPTPDLN